MAFRSWGRFVLGAAAAGTIGWVAFGAGKPVPALDLFDLGMHELGHLLAALMPRMAMFLAGSVLQVAVPLALAGYFLFRRREWASAGFCAAWAGTSARDVAVYVADAPVQALPLIGGGTHDWAYLLGPRGFDCIDRAGSIAGFVTGLGLMMVIAGVVICLWPLVSRLWATRLGRQREVPASRLAVPAGDPTGDPWLAAADLPPEVPLRRRVIGASAPSGRGKSRGSAR